MSTTGARGAEGPGDAHGGTVTAADVLCDPARLTALEHLGLSARPDRAMEHFADWARQAVGAPVALVSLVESDRQVFPGAAGLPEPWSTRRETPLSHSFCQHVVRSEQPLVVTDARTDPLVQQNLAVRDLNVVAYAGMPLTDEAGDVLGSLCVIDTEPRTWTEAELTTLRNIARACSTELRLRLVEWDAGREYVRRDVVEAAQHRAHDRSQTLLVAAQAFAETSSVRDVRVRVGQLAATSLQPSYVGLALRDEHGGYRRTSTDPVGASVDPRVPEQVDPHEPSPTLVAITQRRMVHHRNRDEFDETYSSTIGTVLRGLRLHTVVAVPLLGADEPYGAMVFGWDRPDAVEPADLITIATIAGYTAQALFRAERLDHRTEVARELQYAMLAPLPAVDGVELAAHYRPADARHFVGGDWYDAVEVPGAGSSGGPDLVLTVGDIVGHNLNAATLMGQVRSMLRQAAWDHIGEAPSTVLRAFEAANLGSGLSAFGTAVLFRLHRATRGWSVEWTNAGHPPPVLLLPDGRTELLAEHDILFGYRGRVTTPRRDHHRDLAPGSVLVAYTDGLVERRGEDLDVGITALTGTLHRLRDRPVRQIVDTLVDALAPGAADDDIVVVACRLR